jgi:hypothetical protein
MRVAMSVLNSVHIFRCTSIKVKRDSDRAKRKPKQIYSHLSQERIVICNAVEIFCNLSFFFFYFLAELVFELRATQLLGRHSTT